MKVIPGINELTFEKVKQKIFDAEDFGAPRVHIDVTDGKFTTHQTWNTAKDLLDLRFMINNFNLKLGVHLMVENPDAVIDEWLNVGIKDVVVQFETIKNLDVIMQKCQRAGASFVLCVAPSTSIEQLGDLKKFLDIELLAVDPGASGQGFQESVINRIKELRAKGFAGKIIIDGGINLETIKKVKEAGADVIVSTSYIWDSPSPARAFKQLLTV